MLKNICAIGAILLLSTTSTMAAVPKECAADVKAQCGGVQPGAGRIRACINSHLKDLTPTCQTILVRAAAIGKACRGDVRKICAGVKPGGGRIEAHAAAYCSLSLQGFSHWVKLGRLPGPIVGTTRWDRKAIDAALDVISGLEKLETTSPLDQWKNKHARSSQRHS
jgi:hypothetical protein